jgi:hypothetical protein
MVDDTRRRLEGVPSLPMTGGDVHTKFGSAWIGSVRSESAAPDVLAGGDEEDRPVLDAMAPLCLDLVLKTGSDLAFRKPTNGNEPSHGRITPERARKREVGFVPNTEPEA